MKRIAEVVIPTEKKDPSKQPDGTFLYVDIAAVDNSSFSITTHREIKGNKAPSRARKVIRKDDIIVATTRPYLRSIAQVPVLLDNQICSTGFCVLRPNSEVITDYLYYFALSNSFIEQVVPLMRGANYPAISDQDVLNAQIPLPPLPEQRRIVARIKECLERVEEIERLRAEAMAESSALPSALIDATLDSTEGETVLLGEVCEIKAKLVDPRLPEFLGLPHVGGGNIESCTGFIQDLKTVKQENLKSSKFPFDETVVLYNKIRPYLRKVARPDFIGVCSADMYPLEPDQAKLLRDYLFFVLLSDRFTQYAINGSNRAGMPKVNREHLFRYPLQLPDIEYQRAVVSALNEAFSQALLLKASMVQSKEQLTHLREAILRKAFAGEL